MANAERSFRLPCACTARVAVTAGQAGGRVVCPGCGLEIDVPRLRDLAAYAVDEPRAARAAASGPAGGLLVAGAAVAISAAVAAVALVPVGGLFFPQPPTADQIRAAVASAPVTDVHAAWHAMARSGVGRPASMEELRLQQFAARASGVSRLLWGVSGIGAVVALAGAAIAARGGGSRP